MDSPRPSIVSQVRSGTLQELASSHSGVGSISQTASSVSSNHSRQPTTRASPCGVDYLLSRGNASTPMKTVVCDERNT